MEKGKLNRRDFLRLSAVATTGVVLAACKPAAPAAPGVKKEEAPAEKKEEVAAKPAERTHICHYLVLHI